MGPRSGKSAGAPVTLTPVDALKTHDFWNYTKHISTVMEEAATFLHRTLAPGS